jgi:hypothetical protein
MFSRARLGGVWVEALAQPPVELQPLPIVKAAAASRGLRGCVAAVADCGARVAPGVALPPVDGRVSVLESPAIEGRLGEMVFAADYPFMDIVRGTRQFGQFGAIGRK